jgi:hypothetical protein
VRLQFLPVEKARIRAGVKHKFPSIFQRHPISF